MSLQTEPRIKKAVARALAEGLKKHWLPPDQAAPSRDDEAARLILVQELSRGGRWGEALAQLAREAEHHMCSRGELERALGECREALQRAFDAAMARVEPELIAAAEEGGANLRSALKRLSDEIHAACIRALALLASDA